MRKGFTVIELLVLIGIVSVISALLYPAFNAARAAAKESTALSNAKQIGASEILYQVDYDDQFVLYFSGYAANDPSGVLYHPPLTYWPQTISPYIQAVALPQGRTQALIQDLPGVFVDPAKGTAPQDPNQWPRGNISSWGMSDDIAQWSCPVGIKPVRIPVGSSSVSSPSQCLIFTETWDYYSPTHDLAGSAFASSYFDAASASVNGAMEFLDSPHHASYRKTTALQEPDPKGSNVTLFCDGHAKALVSALLTRNGTMWSVGNDGQWP